MVSYIRPHALVIVVRILWIWSSITVILQVFPTHYSTQFKIDELILTMRLITILTLATLSGFCCASPVEFTVALQHDMRGVETLKLAVADMSNYTHSDYGQYWSVDRILNLVEPPHVVQMFVLGVFRQAGFVCMNHRDALTCRGERSGVYRFFKMDSQQPNYVVPDSIHPYVVFVDGLSNPRKPNNIIPKPSQTADSVDPGYVGTEVLQRLYRVPAVKVNASLGAIEYQNQSGFSNPDLLDSQKNNGLPVNPITAAHNIGTDVYPDTETELDVQMQSQLAAGAELWFWGGSEWLYTWAVKFFNTETVPDVVSHSWGWAIDQQCTIITCNNESSKQYVQRTNIEYLKIAARGVTMVTASGDSGAPGRSDEVCGGVNRTVVSVFPGSSPYVLSTGATSVDAAPNTTHNFTTPLCQQNSCAVGAQESVVNFATVGWTSGGGFGDDLTETTPTWQEPAVQAYLDQKLPLPTHFNKNKRVYPDISVVGHNCPTWQNEQLSSVDGTSCSSPTMSSIIALLNSHQTSRGRPRVGLVAPLLYAMYYDDPSIFTDITKGNNWCTESVCCPTRSDGGSDYGYLAGKGFDPVTGLGTPRVDRMLAWLDKHTNRAGFL